MRAVLVVAVLAGALLLPAGMAQAQEVGVLGVEVEGGGSVKYEGETPFRIFLRDNAVADADIRVTYSFSGTAGNTNDLSGDAPALNSAPSIVFGDATIPAGRNFVIPNVTIAIDSIAEGSETLNIRLTAITPSGSATFASEESTRRASVTVHDTFTAAFTGGLATVDADEGDTLSYNLQISGGIPAAGTRVVNLGFVSPFSSAPAEENDINVVRAANVLHLPATYPNTLASVFFSNSNSAVVQVEITDDGIVEGDENAIIGIVSVAGQIPSGRLVFDQSSDGRYRAIVINRKDDEFIHASISTNAFPHNAEEGGFSTSVHVSNAAGAETFFTYMHFEISGTATAGADYAVTTDDNTVFDNDTRLGYVRLQPSGGNGTLSVQVLADTLTEEDETIIITVTNHNYFPTRPSITGARRTRPQLSFDGRSTVTITRNAPVTIAVTSTADAYAEGQNAIFQFVLSTPSGFTRNRPFVVRYEFYGDVTGDDYTDANNGRITIPVSHAATAANPYVLTIPLSADSATDSAYEEDESLYLRINSVSGGAGGGAIIGTDASTTIYGPAIVHMYISGSQTCIRQEMPDATCPAVPTVRGVEGSTADIPISVSGVDHPYRVFVQYSLSGSAVDRVDYANLAGYSRADNLGQFIFATGTTRLVQIPLLDDGEMDADQTLTVTIAPPGSGNSNTRFAPDGSVTPPRVVVHPAYDDVTVNVVDNMATVGVRSRQCLLTIGVSRLCFDTVINEVNEGGLIHFVFDYVDLVGDPVTTPAEDVTINYRIDGSAGLTAADYRDPFNGSVTLTRDIPENRRRVDIAVNNDTEPENAETLTLVITSVSGGVQSISTTNPSATVTIPSNDGVLVYASTDSLLTALAEGGQSLFNICTLGEELGRNHDAIAVTFSLTGTAVRVASNPTATDDYTYGGALSLSLTPGQTQGRHGCHAPIFQFTVNDDNRNEGAETIIVTVTGATTPAGSSLTAQPSDDPLTFTINASDPLNITVTESNADSIAEGGSLSYVVNYGTAGVPNAPLTVNYTVSGVSVDDITATSLDGSITIPAGGANAAGRTVTITTTDDGDTENAENITVTFTGYSGGGDGDITFTAAEFTNTIAANDGIEVFVTAGGDVDEGGEAVFTLTVIGEVGTDEFTILYQASSTFEGATIGVRETDVDCELDTVDGVCSVDLRTAIPEDNVFENDETITVIVARVYNDDVVGPPDRDRRRASVTVRNTTPLTVSVDAPDADVNEGDDAEFPLSFNLADGVTLPADVTVPYNFGGADVTDSSGSVTVAAGETAGVITVAIPDDTDNEAASELTVTLDADAVTGADVAVGVATATVAASDPVTVTVSGGDTVNEGDNATVNIALSGGDLTDDLVLTYTVAGDGAGDTDGSGVFTIAAADTAPHSFNIAITDDDANEADEEFTVSIIAATAGNADVVDSPQTFTIAANDAITVTASGGGTVAEGNAVTFTITVAGGVRSTELTVPWTIGSDADAATGDATAATDYTVTGTSPLTIAVGESTATVTVTAIEDGVMESAEVFLFTVGSVTGGGPGERMVSGSPQTVTIDASTNKDRVVRLSGPATVAEGATTTNYSVVISGDAPTADVTVTWSITAVTAAAADFMGGALPAGGDLTFTASNYTTAQTFTVITAQDALHEADETFTVGISVATTSTGDTATDGDDLVTAITDNDAVTVTVSGGGAVDEGDSHTFTLTLGGGTRSAAVTVPWSISGTAAAGDYTTTAMTPLSIAAADASGTVVLNIVDDGVMESAETLIFTVDTPSGGGGGAFTVSGSPQTATIAASEDTMRTVAITGPATVTEGDTTTVYSVAITGDRPSTDISVTWSVTADTAAAADFSGGTLPAGATLTFTPGNYATAQTFTIATAEDTLLEASEMFSVNIAVAYSGTGDIAGDGAAAVTAITDDDTASVTVARTDTDAFAEGGTGTAATAVFTVTVADATLTADAVVTFTVGGGTVTDDYTFAPADGMLTISGTTGTVTVTAVDDLLNESNEVITVTVESATTTGSIAIDTDNDAATAAITDDDPLSVTIRAGQSSVLEGGMAVFTVAVAGTSTAAVVVPYSISGDVVAADYTDVGGGELTIAAGQSEGSFSIQTVDDEMMEAAEDLTVTLGTSPSSAGTVNVGAENSATLSIAANASTVRDFSISVDDATVSEGDTVTFTVSIAGRPVTIGTPATVMVMVDAGDSAESTDYTPTTISRALSLNALGNSEFAVTIVDDDINEGAEELTVMLTNPAGGGVGGTGLDVASVTVTIAASDPITYAIGDDAAVSEDATQTHAFSVTLSGAERSEASAVMVPFTVGGSATAGEDYTAPTATQLMFPNGVGTMEIEITVLSDGVFESREDVVIELDEPMGVGAGAGGFTAGNVDARLTILNDDALRVSIARTDSDGFTEGVSGAGGTAVFTVTVANGTSTAPVTVTFAIGGVGITAGDYTVTPTSPLTIAAGVASGTVTVTATADSLGEAAEVLTVTVTDVTGGGGMDPPTVTTAMASATIPGSTAMATVTRVGSGAVDEGDEVQFQITLSEPNAASVMVAWSASVQTQTNTATTGLRRANNAQVPEFVGGDANGLSVSGTVNIPPMTASAMFSLTPNQDASEEDAEEVMVRLGAVTVGNGGGAVMASTTAATVTVRANEAVIRDEALLAEQMKSVSALLGRAAAVLTATVVRERLLRRPTQRAFILGDRQVAVANETVLESATGPWAADPFLRASVAAADATGAAVAASDLVHGTAFALPLFGREWASGDASLWGAGGGISSSGKIGQLSYDDKATAFHIGADREWGDGFVAGLSVARTVGEVDAKQTVSNIEIKNRTESQMVSVHPYVLRRLGDHSHGWLVLGIGKSSVDVQETQFNVVRRASSDLTMTMAAFGAAWRRPGDDICVFDLTVHADGVLTRNQLQSATFDDGSLLPKVTSDTMQVNVETEAGRTWECARGIMRTYATAALRDEFGDAKPDGGTAADVGGRLEWDGANGILLRLRAAKQLVGDGDSTRWSAEVDWNRAHRGFALAPYAQLSTDTWRTGLRMSGGRVTVRFGVDVDEDGIDYRHLLRGDVTF